MHKYLLLFLCASVAYGANPGKPDDAVRAYLLYQYGGDVPNITDVCLHSSDLWMLRGAPQQEKQQAVRNLKVKVGATGLFMDSVDRDICIVELKDGRIDPQFNLATVYQMHRQLILQLLYFSLLQEKNELARLVTNINNVSFGGAPKASYGDMDVYAGVLQIIPVVRASIPDADAEAKSVTYKLPLGDEIFTIRLLKQGSIWKIDTNTKITVPLRYFWR